VTAMSEMNRSESPLESAAGAAGPQTTEAFALLADETRLAILLALWEEYDQHADDNLVPFSQIFDRVAYDDSGNLRYHLEKLEGQFVRRHPDGGGYELRLPGTKLVRTVIAGAGTGASTFERTEIDQPCLICDAPTAISYRDGHLYWTCTECEGVAPDRTEMEGFLSVHPFAPAGLEARTPEEIQVASLAAERRQIQSMFDGFCPDCSGAVDGRLVRCRDHTTDGTCETCGRRFAVWARFRCVVCKRAATLSPKTLALFHPAVIAFYYDHGLSVRFHADHPDRARQIFDRMHEHEMEIVSSEPPAVMVSAAMDGDEIRLTFDESISVVDVCR
jgi:predicted RNA-binding Zn-ribbon protein involved in translation (DUF1610 family)